MDKRTILAVALSLIVLIGWSVFFQKTPAPVKKATEEASPLRPEQPAAVQTEKPIQPDIPQPDISFSGAGQDIVIETDLYHAAFSSKGGIATSWTLKKYQDHEGNPVTLLKEPGVIPPLGMILEGPEGPDRHILQKVIYTSNTSNINLISQGSASAELVLAYQDSGMSVRKKFVFHNDSYRIDLTIDTMNVPQYLLPIGTDFGVYDKQQREHKGPVMQVGTDREEFDSGLKSSRYFTGQIHWIGQEDKYFTAALIPLSPVEGASVWKEGASAEVALKLKPQKQDFIFYIGPKEYDRLKSFNAGLENMVDFGWFSIVAMPLFWVLKLFYKYLGNYGWAIILLTIVVRVPFIPILNKSQQSMKKMQKIQPMMAELKEKYKKDPVKMQKETMALYKKYKVNPVGGCLPMFLQIPVFIALYNVLLKAIELRGAPFILWITDLAAKDPYYVFPIVMGATMVIQQKMTPSAMDPKQAKIMMLMPIVFTFMFLSFPAGLVIYWLVNNILGIAHQFYANKKAAVS